MFFVTYFIGIWTCIVEMSDFFPHWPPFALRKMKFNFRYFLISFKGYPSVTLSELVHSHVLRKLNNLFDKDKILEIYNENISTMGYDKNMTGLHTLPIYWGINLYLQNDPTWHFSRFISRFSQPVYFSRFKPDNLLLSTTKFSGYNLGKC